MFRKLLLLFCYYNRTLLISTKQNKFNIEHFISRGRCSVKIFYYNFIYLEPVIYSSSLSHFIC